LAGAADDSAAAAAGAGVSAATTAVVARTPAVINKEAMFCMDISKHEDRDEHAPERMNAA
jgi:hypothetical protein